MTITLQLVDNISEIAALDLVDSIELGYNIPTKELRITRPLNIIQLKMRWKTKRPDITSLTIVENKYIYCPKEKREWLNIWLPLLIPSIKPHHISLQAEQWESLQQTKPWTQNLLILPEYYGDYSFHFGHFLMDVLPILKCLREKQSEQNRLSGLKYSLYPLLEFHRELISVENLHSQVVVYSNKEVLHNLIYADRSRVIWAEQSQSRIVQPTLNYGFARAVMSKINEHNSSDYSESQDALQELKCKYKGLIYDRSGSSLFRRLANVAELHNRAFSVQLKSGQFQFSFDSFDYIETGVYGRIQKARDYDFVIGPFGSHFLPTMIECNIMHMFIVPFKPSQSLIEERLEGFLYYPKNLYQWILANPPSAYVGEFNMESFHYTEYKMDIDYVLHQIATALNNARI